MKKWNCLFAMHELWKYFFAIINYEIKKCLFAILKLWKHENICLQYMNNENMKIFAYITWIMKIFVGIHPFETHELWNRKISVCNKWIMKKWKCLFAKHEYEHLCLHYMNYENSVCNTWIMKYKNVCLQYTNYEKMKIFVVNMNYENICLKYMNYEKMKLFVRNAWIMKIFFCNKLIMKLRKCLLQYSNYENMENICLQYMNNETWTFLLILHELWKYFVGITSIWNTWIMKIGKICLQ